MYLLINLDSMTMVATGDHRALAALAFDDFPEAAIQIGPADHKNTFRDFTEAELKLLYRNSTGSDPVGMTRWNGIDMVMPLVEKLPPCTKQIPLDSLVKPAEAREAAAPLIIARPKAGTATGRVWDIADIHYQEMAEEWEGVIQYNELKAMVIRLCEAEGINGSTAAVQFGKWKKHQQSL